VSAHDRRTVGELLADSDGLARETLVDATLDHAPAMVRSWNLVVGSAADLWAVLPSAQGSPFAPDLMGRLRAVAEAIGGSVAAGHWPGYGSTDERLTQIANNLSIAASLVERRSVGSSRPTTPQAQADNQDLHGQVEHTLYIAAHGTAVALRAYVTDLQDRLEVGTRRRQPLVDRPTVLEIDAVHGMIARFGVSEQLAARSVAGQQPSSTNPRQVRSAAPATRLETALAG
jgi:hypothetical protein